MADFISLLDNATSKIISAMAMMAQTVTAPSPTVSNATVIDAHEGHEGEGTDASLANPLPGLTGDARKIDNEIGALEREQADLLEERRMQLAIASVFGAGDSARERMAEIDERLAEIQTEIDDKNVLLRAEFDQIHNDSIADLEARLAGLPSHPNFSDLRFEIQQEIDQRNELFAAGITEPYHLDVLIDMSNSSDPLERNTFDRVLNGDVTLLSYSDQEATLEEALAFDRNFDPRTEIALRLPPNDRIKIYPRNVGGLSLGDTGFILLKDNQGERVLIHEVNHSINADNNLDHIGTHTGDDREAIRSFTTEVRAYSVDNRYESDAIASASSVAAAHPRANRTNIILNDLGYDPANLVGNQVHIAEAVEEVTAGFPPPPNALSDEQIAQIERIYIADFILDHDIAVDNPIYDEAVAQYDATTTVKDTINEIIVDGVGGIEDNGPPADGTS